ncbi:MAG: hypothetical protein R3A45_05045 [Bdellovibrionota bacterium]
MFKNIFARQMTIFTLLITVLSSLALAQENQSKVALSSIKKFNEYAKHLSNVSKEKLKSDKFKEIINQKITETFLEAYENTLLFTAYEIEHANDQVTAGIKPYNVAVSADFYHTFLTNTSVNDSNLLFLFCMFVMELADIEETMADIETAKLLQDIVSDPTTLSDSLKQFYDESSMILEIMKNNQPQLNTDKIIVIKLLNELESKIKQRNISEEKVSAFVILFGFINELVRS